MTNAEDKTFGTKYYAWGHYAGTVTQAEADQRALDACRLSLLSAKDKKAGGKEMYDFGKKDCELYAFINKSVSLPPPIPAPPATNTADIPMAAITPAPDSTVGWQVYHQVGDRVLEINLNSFRREADNIFFEYRERSLVSNPAYLRKTMNAVVDCKASKRSDVYPDSSYEMRDIYSGTIQAKQFALVCQSVPVVLQASQIVVSPTSAPTSQSAESPTARKLRELNQLRKDNLITEREYNEKRKAILSAM